MPKNKKRGVSIGLMLVGLVVAVSAGILIYKDYKNKAEYKAWSEEQALLKDIEIQERQLRYGQALLAGNNINRLTIDDLVMIEENIVKSGALAGDAEIAIVGLVHTGMYFDGQLERYATAAVQGSMVVGIPISTSIRNFENLEKRPIKESLYLTEKLNYLNVVTLEQIRSYEEAYEHEKAARLAMDTYADRLMGMNTLEL